jgi:hypothetical protein
MIPTTNQRRTNPDLCVLLDQVIDRVKTSINCVSIGKITTFYPTTQTADIQLMYRGVNLYDGSTTEMLPLVKCPVVCLNGGNGALTFPIASGDTCLVFFNDREIDSWYVSNTINTPASVRTHDLNDGIALVGIRSELNPLSSYRLDGIELKHPGIYATGNFVPQAGATGSFTTSSGETVIVNNGIITAIIV